VCTKGGRRTGPGKDGQKWSGVLGTRIAPCINPRERDRGSRVGRGRGRSLAARAGEANSGLGRDSRSHPSHGIAETPGVHRNMPNPPGSAPLLTARFTIWINGVNRQLGRKSRRNCRSSSLVLRRTAFVQGPTRGYYQMRCGKTTAVGTRGPCASNCGSLGRQPGMQCGARSRHERAQGG
jgi:hypothetical protein